MADYPIERGHIPTRKKHKLGNLPLHIGPVRPVVVTQLFIDRLRDARIGQLRVLRLDEVCDVNPGPLIECSRPEENVMADF